MKKVMDSKERLKIIEKSLKDFPKIVRQKKIAAKKRQKILDNFKKAAPTILKQIKIKY